MAPAPRRIGVAAVALVEIRAAGFVAPFDRHRGRLDRIGVGSRRRSATRRVSVVNSIALRKAISLGPSCGSSTSSSSGSVERRVGPQRHQLARQAAPGSALAMMFSRRFGLLDLAGAGEQRVEIAELFQQLRGRLGADARDARHVVGQIAGHRLQVDHLVRRHAPFLDDLGNARSACPSCCRTCETFGVTSCIRSLSEETIVTSAPAASASRA